MHSGHSVAAMHSSPVDSAVRLHVSRIRWPGLPLGTVSTPGRPAIERAHRLTRPNAGPSRSAPPQVASPGGSPRAVAYIVLASGPGYQAGALSAGGSQLLAVPQAFPGVLHVKRGPASVVPVVPFVRHPGKCAMPTGEISSSSAATAAALRLSASPCSQNLRSISHSAQ
jgi:hypothetical protein